MMTASGQSPDSSRAPQPLCADDALRLVPQHPDHAEAMFAVLSDPALHEFLDDGPPASVDVLRARYQRQAVGRSPDGQEIWLNWVIQDPQGRCVGSVQATVVPQRGWAWVAYLLERPSQGRGWARAATAAMLEELRRAWACRRFLACVEQAHLRSARLLQSQGFRRGRPDECAPHALSASEVLWVLDDLETCSQLTTAATTN